MFLSAACLAVWGPAGNPSDRPLRSASHLPNTPTENTGCHEKRRSTNLGKFKPLVFESWTSDQASSAAYVSASLAATSKKPAVSSLLLRHLSMHVLYWFTLLSSNLSLLSASSLLCFSSVHIVGSLTSKLPSTIWNRLFSAFLGGLIRNITWNHPRPTPKSRCFPAGTTRGGSCEGQCILRAASRRSEYTASEHVDNRTPILPSTWCFCRRLVLQSEALQAIPAIALFGRPVIFRTHLQKTQAAMRKDVQPTLANSNPWCLSRGRRTKLLLQRTSLPRWPPPRRNQRYRPYCSAICPCMSCIDLLFFLLIFLFSLPLPCSAFHLSILSEVWLLNFLRSSLFKLTLQILHILSPVRLPFWRSTVYQKLKTSEILAWFPQKPPNPPSFTVLLWRVSPAETRRT